MDYKRNGIPSEGCCPFCGAYNIPSAIVCVRCSQIINQVFINSENDGMSSPQSIYDDVISSDVRLFHKAARTCMAYQSLNLLENLKTIYFGTHPLSGQRTKLGENAKGQILMAMALIRMPQASLIIVEVIKKDSWNALDSLLGVYATYALSIYQPDQSVIDYVVKEKESSLNVLERYLCYEAAKKSSSPETIRTLLKGTEADILFLSRQPSPSIFGGGFIGLIVDLMNLSVYTKQQFDSTLTAILAVSPKATPIHVYETISPDIQYIWSLQRRIDTIEALTEKLGNNALGGLLPSISNRRAKILAACVIQRRSPGHQSWLPPIIDAASGSSITISGHYEVVAIDALLRLGNHIPTEITRKAVTSGLSNSATYVTIATAISIVLNRQTDYYQDVINLKNSPDSNVHLGSAMAMFLMGLLHPDLKDNLRQLVAKMAITEQVESFRVPLETLAQNWDATGEGTFHDVIISLVE